MPMQRWIASADGGTNQRLNPGFAMMRSRSSIPGADPTPSARGSATAIASAPNVLEFHKNSKASTNLSTACRVVDKAVVTIARAGHSTTQERPRFARAYRYLTGPCVLTDKLLPPAKEHSAARHLLLEPTDDSIQAGSD